MKTQNSHDPTVLFGFVLTERPLTAEMTYCVFKVAEMTHSPHNLNYDSILMHF